MPLSIATFNVNSVKARLPRILEWLKEASPDVACLQEIKCLDENFPRMEIEELGYRAETHGQKTYNGVAILSKHEMNDITRGLPGNDGDNQARYMEATVKGVRIACIYLPNGNPAPGEKYDYKLNWMDHLIRRGKELLAREQPAVLAGDFNVIPGETDAHDPDAWREDALFRPETRVKFRELLYQGWLDALAHMKPGGHAYTFWDYQGGAWARDKGIRIDHFLLSPQAADRLKDAVVDRPERGKEKASDHAPVRLTLAG